MEEFKDKKAEGMTLGLVIEYMKKPFFGEVKAFRSGWNGKNQYIMLQTPDENSKMTEPYIYMVIAGTISTDEQKGSAAKTIPWLASQADLLAEDWMIIK